MFRCRHILTPCHSYLQTGELVLLQLPRGVRCEPWCSGAMPARSVG
jgi:hypothetical protein